MAATGRDIAVFVSGLVLAGFAPIYLLPGLELGPMLAVASRSAGGLPLEHVGVVAFIALLGAAWIDTAGSSQPTVDAEQWD
ncbi:hypothetical protein [Halorientalis salina]|uniref:hypothetical protein n=1 Tax=Halorientalis salina TaxID=2932266 RepID=UPI0010AC794F|nr:hypothetical protein [Halorientalis salina]